MTIMRISHFLLFAAALSLPSAAGAQIAARTAARPDAGQTLRETERTAPALRPDNSGLVIDTPARAPAASGGAAVTIHKIIFDGNNVFSDEELRAAIGPAQNQSLTLAGMKDIAARVTAYYRAHNHPFTRALIPAQNMKDNVLTIQIIEGVYGRITVTGDDARAPAAQEFLSPLHPGAPITGDRLERTTLILDDQPGYSILPVMRPGQNIGMGDLVVELKREKRFGGDIGVDNHGNSYTGRLRAYADFNADSPFMLGDQFRLSTLYTEEDMWYGSAAYNLPLGMSGLRANIAYTHTYYELGRSFAAIDAHGTARVASGGLSYPLLRSQKANAVIGLAYQHKWLNDKIASTNTDDSKFSQSLPLSLSFDLRDTLGGGGVTYGGVSVTPGSLDLDSTLRAVDRATARSHGDFVKYNLDLARLQSLPHGFTAFARISAQAASKNLDSSESFGLGGPSGVRAYPTGEGYGDEGALAQFEIRYRVNQFAPYVFYDIGHVKFNESSWTADDNDRTVAGAGVGLRLEWNGWHADASAAWATQGGDPQSDTRDPSPIVWLRAGYKF